MAEMITCDWLMITVYVVMCIDTIESCYLFSAMFIFGASNFNSRCIWNEKPMPQNGVDLWRWFLERVSWA